MDTVGLFCQLRRKRNEKLAETDWMVLPDTPLNKAQYRAIETYREALRGITELAGAPWDGGGPETPWPELPR